MGSSPAPASRTRTVGQPAKELTLLLGPAVGCLDPSAAGEPLAKRRVIGKLEDRGTGLAALLFAAHQYDEGAHRTSNSSRSRVIARLLRSAAGPSTMLVKRRAGTRPRVGHPERAVVVGVLGDRLEGTVRAGRDAAHGRRVHEQVMDDVAGLLPRAGPLHRLGDGDQHLGEVIDPLRGWRMTISASCSISLK